MPAEVDEYPYTGYPRGWFQIGWSSDFPVGTTVPLYYFGRHLVAYRGESRAVHVFDAHCAHMGAHLGFGGMVEGDCIRCPYHGWKYDQNGQNIEIPDSDRAYPRVRLAGWPVSEQAELVLMWYDAEDRRPLWDPPQVPEFGLPDSYMLSPDLRHIWRNLKMRPQYIVENTVDISHQKWVHHSPSEHELIEWEIDGAMCRTRQTITFGVGKALADSERACCRPPRRRVLGSRFQRRALPRH